MRTIENPDAVFDAAVLNWNVLTERSELAAAGTLQECQRYWEQVRLEGYGGRMQLIRQERRRVFMPEKPKPQASDPMLPE